MTAFKVDLQLLNKQVVKLADLDFRGDPGLQKRPNALVNFTVRCLRLYC